MNKVALDKIIKKIVYQECPYIVDHKIDVKEKEWWTSWGVDRFTEYRVDLYVGREKIEGVDMEKVLDVMDKAQQMVFHLFKVLGHNNNEAIDVHYSLNEHR
jgi:hypothetical protein